MKDIKELLKIILILKLLEFLESDWSWKRTGLPSCSFLLMKDIKNIFVVCLSYL